VTLGDDAFNMQEDHSEERYLVHAVDSRQNVPTWLMPLVDIDKVIEASFCNSAQDAGETVAAGNAYLEKLFEREELRYLAEIDHRREITSQALPKKESPATTKDKAVCSARQMSQKPLSGESTLPENSPEWIISVPLIEREIKGYYAKYQRAPTEAELEGEVIYGCYREVLTLLKCLELAMLHLEGRAGSTDEWITYLSASSEDDAVLGCVRSEMHRLFTDAISNLPHREGLVITVDYEKERSGKRVSVTLDLPSNAIAHSSIRACLSVRASVPDADLGELGPHARSLLSEPAKGSISTRYQGNGRRLSLVDWDVAVWGYQCGLLPISLHGKWGDNSPQWTRYFVSKYCFDNEHRLHQTRREARYQLKLEA
jgi:hypothetical protein